MKFRFSLQSVLEQREHIEEQAKLALGKELAKLQVLETELHRLQEDFDSIPAKQKALPRLDGPTMMHFVQWGSHLRKQINAQNSKIDAQKVLVEDRRKTLAEKARDRRAMEILKEKQLAEFHLVRNKAEAKATDEAGRDRFMRKVQEENGHG